MVLATLAINLGLSTVEIIHENYKEDYIHSLAEKWRGKIEERAYQALKSWTVYP